MIRWTDADVAAFADGRVIVRDGVLGPERRAAVEAEILRWDAGGGLVPAGIGREGRVVPEVRGDRLAWLDEVPASPALAALWSDLQALGREAREALWIGLCDMSVQVARYDAGAAYARHRDAFRERSSRRLTAVLYVHGAWEPAHGGQLRAWEPDGPVDIDPLPGRMVLFAADRVEHAVLPAHAPRLAVTAWFRDRPDA